MRWIVDGMNVIGSRPDGWWRDRDGARARLVEELSSYARATGDSVSKFARMPTATACKAA